MNREIEPIRHLFPTAHYQGLVGGSHKDWQFLMPLTGTQVLDFCHMSQYLTTVAHILYKCTMLKSSPNSSPSVPGALNRDVS